ncbi:hypothetical protein HMPREF1985_01082 [Mitsuokella sp. oral taxon 131 str. W9106]|nr:hypothetical protein HMPREF1985_01082 [Mitsuokella sp. oral taxon 131 str. W9106]
MPIAISCASDSQVPFIMLILLSSFAKAVHPIAQDGQRLAGCSALHLA